MSASETTFTHLELQIKINYQKHNLSKIYIYCNGTSIMCMNTVQPGRQWQNGVADILIKGLL